MIRETARAKVNLTLRVLRRRDDGYHDIASLVTFADIGDVVTFYPGRPAAVSMSGPGSHDVVGENIAERALREIALAEPTLTLGAIHIEKWLPVAAGVGGGSADAAGVLRAVRTLNEGSSEAVDWLGLAARLGADVPVCLASESTWMTGVGEKLSPVSRLPNLNALLVNLCDAMPADKTAQVFKTLARQRGPQYRCDETPPAPPAPGFADADQLLGFMADQGNDLEAAAIEVVPSLRELFAQIRQVPGLIHAALSGAGPTVLAVFEDTVWAQAKLRKTLPDAWIRPVRLG